MKVHVNPDGTMDFDVQSADDIKLLREATTNGHNAEAPKTMALNEIQYEAWTFLVENDNEFGVHFMRYAEAKEITDKAAHYRLKTLVNMGYAKRVARGKYRAEC